MRTPRMVLVSGLLLASLAGSAPAANLLANPGFEQAEDGWRTWPRKGQPAFAIDSQVPHNGTNSARIEVQEEGTDGSWVQDLPCEPSVLYQFSFRFKTAEPDKRISFLAEFVSANGQYAGQHRMEFACRGTSWTRASGRFRTPFNAANMMFEVWVNLGNTDVTTAWFDDCRLRPLSPAQQFSTALDEVIPEIVGPAHRVLWKPDEDIVVRLPWSLDAPRGRDVEYRLTLAGNSGAVAERTGTLSGPTEAAFRGETLTADGAYTLNCTLRSAGRDRQLAPQTIMRKVDAQRPPGAAILDEKGTLLVDGEPFFPIGVYYTPTDKWPALKAHGFNTVHAWLPDNEEADRRLQAAEALGLKVAAEMSDTLRWKCDLDEIRGRVERMKDSPALLCWYPVDEPGPSGTPLPGLLESYNLIRRLDPFHPILQVQCNMALLDTYGLACDVIATDPYGSTTQVAQWVQLSYASQRVPRAVWAVLQAFPYPDLPTPERLVCDTFIALINGAKGLLYFSFGYEDYQMDQSPLWEAFGELNPRVTSLAPVLLEGEKLDIPPGDASVSQVGMWRHEGFLYVLAANCSEEPAELTFPLPKGICVGPTAEVLFENRAIAAEGAIQDQFGSYGTHVYRVELK